MLCQVAPESVDLYTPSPKTSASRIAHASPVPAQTCAWSEVETARAPIACTDMLSEIGAKVAPESLDFHTPPDAAPTYQVLRSPGTPLIDANRPPLAGPSSWNRNGSGTAPRAPP